MKSDTSVSGQSFKAKKPRPEDDDAFSIRRPRASKVFNRVQREKGSGGGTRAGGLLAGGSVKKPPISKSHPLRPSPRGPALRAATRRCMVKVSYVTNKKTGQWAAHGRYLEREGAQKEGELGEGFDADSDDGSLSSKMHQWQMAGDARLFKIVLSPEDGGRMQLKAYTHEFMSRLQVHMGKDLEWVAIDHYNTGHPHTHIVLRGKDNLQISPDLIRHGMRKIAEDIATERLGYKSELEIQKSKEKEIDARQFTAIDRDIQSRQQSGPMSTLTYVTEGRCTQHVEQVAQRLRIRRLDVLKKLGVAEKVGGMTWALDAGWDKALRDLQVLQQRTAMVAQGRALMTDPRCPAVVTKIMPGDHLVGRVLGTGLDEQFDRSFILIEGADSRVHIVYQNNAIEKERSVQHLQPRSLVALSGKSFEKDGKTVAFQKVTEYDLSIPDQHFKSVKIPEQALDDALDAGTQPSESVRTGFQAIWHSQLRDRILQREKEKALKKVEAIQVKKEKWVKQARLHGKLRGHD